MELIFDRRDMKGMRGSCDRRYRLRLHRRRACDGYL